MEKPSEQLLTAVRQDCPSAKKTFRFSSTEENRDRADTLPPAKKATSLKSSPAYSKAKQPGLQSPSWSETQTSVPETTETSPTPTVQATQTTPSTRNTDSAITEAADAPPDAKPSEESQPEPLPPKFSAN